MTQCKREKHDSTYMTKPAKVLHEEVKTFVACSLRLYLSQEICCDGVASGQLQHVSLCSAPHQAKRRDYTALRNTCDVVTTEASVAGAKCDIRLLQ